MTERSKVWFVGTAQFEAPPLAGGFQYAPGGVAWVFSGNTGITGNGNAFTSGNPVAPEGVQVAFVQQGGSVSQTANLSAGQYTVSFKAAQRGNYQLGAQVIEVRVDGAPAQTWPLVGADDSLLTWVTRTRLPEDQRRPRLHAAALAAAAGRAVVVLGDPGAGKSTLTAHLAHGGLDLVTDEQLTVFADHGMVGAFTRPVLLKRPSLDHLPAGVAVRDPGDHPRLVVPAASLGSRHRLWGRPVLVVLPERVDDHEGAPTWDLLAPAVALAELCGLAPREGIGARSLTPLLRDPNAPWDRPALTTHGRNNHSLRTERWRYIRYEDGSDELYDHDSDPLEWVNLAGREEYVAVKQNLARWFPTVNAPDVPSRRQAE